MIWERLQWGWTWLLCMIIFASSFASRRVSLAELGWWWHCLFALRGTSIERIAGIRWPQKQVGEDWLTMCNVQCADMTRRSGIYLLEEKELSFSFSLQRIVTFPCQCLHLPAAVVYETTSWDDSNQGKNIASLVCLVECTFSTLEVKARW